MPSFAAAVSPAASLVPPHIRVVRETPGLPDLVLSPLVAAMVRQVTDGTGADILEASPDGDAPVPDTSEKPRTSYHTKISEIPTDERPRERLIQYGADVLSTSELLAILLRTGNQRYSAIGLADHILASSDGLRGVARATIEQLSHIHGVGSAKAAQIKAAIEFGRRLVAASPDERTRIGSPRDVYNLLGTSLREEKREHFVAILLDTKNGVLRTKTVSVGDLSSSVVHPREVFAEAIRHSAASLIIAHNHPSGDPTPSPDDIAVTRRLQEGGELLGIEVLDHIVLGDNRFVSLKEKGLM